MKKTVKIKTRKEERKKNSCSFCNSLFFAFSSLSAPPLSRKRNRTIVLKQNNQQSHIDDTASAPPSSGGAWIAAMHLSYHSPARSKSPRSA